MRLQATVLGEGKTRHLLWDAGNASAMPVEPPATVEIVEEAGAAYLLRFNTSGEYVADTWHEDGAAAKAQAAFEYGIGDDDWAPLA